MKKNVLLTVIAVVLLPTYVLLADTGLPSIITHIEANSKVRIHQSRQIDDIVNLYISDALLAAQQGPYVGEGYRVQVYSSNDQRTAKNTSLSIEKKILNYFAAHNVYRTFSSPFWKVRVGDFRTMDDAQAFRDELIEAFPVLGKTMYVVKENQVTITE